MVEQRKGRKAKNPHQGLKKDASGAWWVDCYVGTRRIRRRCESLSDAKKALADIRSTGLPPATRMGKEGLATRRDITMAAIIDAYLSVPRDAATLLYAKKWRAAVGSLQPASITVQLLRDFVRDALEQASVATVHRQVDVLRAIWLDGCGNEHLALPSPFRNKRKLGLPRIDNIKTAALTAEQEDALRRELGERWAPCLDFAVATAIRLANLAELTWADIDWERRLIWLNDVKARTRMSVPLSRMALDALGVQRARFGDGHYCFPAAGGKHRLNKDTFRNRVWRPAMQRAGIPESFTWHDLRHSAATHMLDAGADLYTVCDVLGHADFRTTQRYAHVRDERRRAAVERLDRNRLSVPAWPRKIQIIDTESTNK